MLALKLAVVGPLALQYASTRDINNRHTHTHTARPAGARAREGLQRESGKESGRESETGWHCLAQLLSLAAAAAGLSLLVLSLATRQRCPRTGQMSARSLARNPILHFHSGALLDAILPL